MDDNAERKNIITKINDGFCYVEKAITGFAFAIMLTLLLIQVVCRYCFHLPLAWAEELIRYSYIAVSFLGAIVATREKSHIAIDILPFVLQKAIKKDKTRLIWENVFDIVQEIACIVFWVLVSYWMITYNMSIAAQNQITTANEWPVWIMCLPVSISCVMMAFHNFLNLLENAIGIRRVRTGGVS